jgi:hypothetical protein
VEAMGVELTFAMSTDSSASMRVQSMLLPVDHRYENHWIEEDDHTFLVIRVPEPGVEQFRTRFGSRRRTFRRSSTPMTPSYG